MNRLVFQAILGCLMLFAAPQSRGALLIDPAGGTPLLADSTDDDDVAAGRPLGFAFSFFGGDARTTVDVAVNGNLNFSKDSEFTNRPMPSLADTARISPLWDDLELMKALGDSIMEKVEPGVYYSITWTAHSRLNLAARHVFQVVLFGQATRIGSRSFRVGDIVFAYETLGGAFDKGTATVGLDSGDETNFATVPDLVAAGGEAKSRYAPDLLRLSGGQVLFRPVDGADGSTYSLPVLTNHAPTPVDDAGYGSGVITIPVLANDLDADGDLPILDAVTQGASGSVTANLDGTVTYTPGARFSGTDTFSYTMLDGLGGSATGTVRIMPFAVAKGAYDGPLLAAPDPADPVPAAAAEELGHLKLSVKDAGNFDAELSFPDGGLLRFQGQFSAAGRYSALVASLPTDEFEISCQLALSLDFLNGVNRISGTADLGDGVPLGLIAPRSVNSPPEARNDLFYLGSRGKLVLTVLNNDTDRDGDALTITSFSQGQSGSVTRSADGKTLTYQPFTLGGGTDRLSYTVSDPMGLTSTAQVTVLTLASAGGAYAGLVSSVDPDTGALVAESSGQLRLSVTKNGAFTAALSYGGAPYIVRGSFNAAGDFSGKLKLPEDVALTLKLHLDLTQDTNQVTGTLTDADGLTVARVTVGRSRYRARFFTAPQAGAYAVLPAVDEFGQASAFGYARLVVSATGGVTVAGKLADGFAFTVGAQLQMDGTIPFFLSRRVPGTRRTGFVLGTLTFANPLARSDLTGHLTSWMPPSDDDAEPGSTDELDVTGAFYVPPRAAECMLTLPLPPANAEIDLNGQPITATITVNNRVTVDPTDTNHLTFSLQPKTGLFTGTFREVVDLESGAQVLVRRTFSGIILRQQNRGGGVYVGSEGAGTITVGPATAQP